MKEYYQQNRRFADEKTIFVVLAAVCLAVGILLLPKSGGKVQPENPGTLETTKDDIVDQFNDPTLDPFDFTDENGNRYLDTGEYPEKLDLREYGIVTPVRLQNPFGTCWGFAAAAAAETQTVYNGSELKPEPSVYNVHNELLKKDTDYTLSYIDNVKCGVMVVKAAGINDYHEETEGYLPVLPQRGIIRDAKSSGGKITVEAENMGESGITGYVVRWRVKGTEEWNETRTSADQPSVVLKDTRKGAAYEVQVCGYIDTKDKAEEYYGIENEYLGEFSETSEVTCN